MEGSVQNYKQVFHYRLLSQRKVKVFFFNSVAIECKSMPFVELGTFNTWVSAVYMDSFVY